MAYNIKLQAFEGPFDLLFHLIEKNEIDIYDIPINEVADQYMEYIRAMETLDLEITSEFLVMAATLLEIKSKMLLPVEVVDHVQLEFEELDPRHELVRRLLEYKKYKMAAEVFREKEDVSKKLYFKPREEIIFEVEENHCKLLENLEMSDLMTALEKMLSGKHIRDKRENTFHQMQRDAFTIDEKINEILDLLSLTSTLKFNSLFAELESRNEMITTFLALLELIKLKKISVRQEMSFTEIEVNLKNIS
ncbi:segregation and condensation protein A [Alkaliphilus hydrothermalis]|uniref:Segregation and condensation protein A n=1 Tax=Alkaliphilus hydrothermalis TaxID=1482730 RepID=A0ABS2NM93_9FIRM|nr:segregation/condensation protein A [Alkaliphilus hydrothermalis]MBM7614036.1 segregation and condensation protein A [Alkaliphilus hydrothermalis]